MVAPVWNETVWNETVWNGWIKDDQARDDPLGDDRLRDDRLRDEPVWGLVLSGGGSRASFQIGALRYLYQNTDINPRVVVGTSGGAIVGSMIAQFADARQQARAVERLEEIWFSMREQGDMFSERPWFSRLRRRSQEWIALMHREAARPAPSWSLPRISLFSRDVEPEASDDDAPADEPGADPAQLTGQAETLRLAMEDRAPSGSAWTPQLAMTLMSMLPRLRGASTDLALILRGADSSRSMYHPGPLLATLLDPTTFSAVAVESSGVVARLAIVGLHSGDLHFMREDGRIVDRHDRLLGGSRHDVSRGVLASCSIPAVFPPVEMDGEWYVDGGVRENVPAEIALDHLGVTRCIVISCATAGVRPATGFDTKSMLAVMMRATEIMADETSHDEISGARRAGALVIEPEVMLHEPLTVDPGLIRINRDYGWMRAAEAHLGATPQDRALHRRLVELRLQAHALESRLQDDDVADWGSDPELLVVKEQLRTHLEGARPEYLPEGSEAWWATPEAHPRPDGSEQLAQLGD